MDLDAPDNSWLKPKQKAANMAEQMTYLRTGSLAGVICPHTTKE
ncbi:hypothetical protein [Bradyrhizobium sp. CCBAU 21362]|nr:hypothetical protein [Bradyrhizobium sp. CCBAU 21362]